MSEGFCAPFREGAKPKATLIVSLPLFFILFYIYIYIYIYSVFAKGKRNYKKIKHEYDRIFKKTIGKGLAAPPSVVGRGKTKEKVKFVNLTIKFVNLKPLIKIRKKFFF